MTKRRQFCPRNHDTFQVGRDASKKCLKCKAEDAAAKRILLEQAVAERHAAFQRQQAELDRRREQEYRAAIKRGGYDATMARWDKACDEVLEKTESQFALCQWEDDDAEGRSMGRMCYRRTDDVYCYVHNRQLDREQAKEAKR